MKYFVKSIFVLVAILIASSSFAQAPTGETGPAFSVGQKWLETVNINTQFPDPDKIKIGDTVKVSVENKTIIFVADSSLNSQWAVTVAAIREMAVDKQAPISVTVVPKKNNEKMFWYLIYAILVLLFLTIVIAWLLYVRSKDQHELLVGAEELLNSNSNSTPLVVSGPPILENVPDFSSATEKEIYLAAESAISNTFKGRNFEIIGEVERGVINGKMKIFFADGSSQVEKFKNEPGYRTIIHFLDSEKTKKVVWRSSCFNPLWSANDAQFYGTFFPKGKNRVLMLIDKISQTEEKEISHRITMSDEEIEAKVAIEQVPASVEAISEVKEIKLTEITVGKTILKGDIFVNKFTIGFITKIMKEASLSFSSTSSTEKSK